MDYNKLNKKISKIIEKLGKKSNLFYLMKELIKTPNDEHIKNARKCCLIGLYIFKDDDNDLS